MPYRKKKRSFRKRRGMKRRGGYPKKRASKGFGLTILRMPKAGNGSIRGSVGTCRNFPDEYYCCLQYQARVQDASANQFVVTSFNVNWLNDMDNLSNNAQGALLLGTIYNRNVVLGCSWKFTYINESTSMPFLCMLEWRDGATAPTSSSQMSTQAFSQTKVAAAATAGGSASTVTLSGYINYKAIAGQSLLADIENFECIGTAAPTRRLTMNFGSQNIVGTSSQNYQGYLQMKLYTKWMFRVPAAAPTDDSEGNAMGPVVQSGNLERRLAEDEEKRGELALEQFEALDMEMVEAHLPKGPAVKRRIVPSRV